ncbi:MAG: hypothetical protein KDM81_10415, partial [Verrucomicrobiae bacterium]|nr:hypothetical protein [Verrucomicrobiae bacterium]
PDDPDLQDLYSEVLAEYETLLAEYEALNVPPDFGEWPYSENFKKDRQSSYKLNVKLADLKYLQWGQWGEPWIQKRLVTVAVRVQLDCSEVSEPLELTWMEANPEAQLIIAGEETIPSTLTAWAYNPNVPLEVQRTSWSDNAFAFRYELQHPKQGHFFPGPVHGLTYRTATHEGITGSDSNGGVWYYPGEEVQLNIGNVDLGYAKADTRMTPLDIFPGAEPSDPTVVNLMRLLMGMDGDGQPNGSIQITDENMAALESKLGSATIDFGNTLQVDALLTPPLINVTVEEAQALLEETAGNLMMRRNVSKTPEFAVDKPKLDIMPVWVPAKTANGDDATIEYRDDEGNLLETRDRAKPLFVTYTEEQEPNESAGILRGGSDIITAVSMDDGATWKRFNVSHMANKSSFTLENGERYPGHSRGPQQKISEDKILISWTSAYARGGKPSFAIKTGDDYPYDDAYAVDDVWGVRGRQGSVNYDEDKDVGDQGIGEIPYSAVWACRGVLVWEGNADKFPDAEIGEVVWFKPERLTSGRRDAFFIVSGGAKNVGFAIAWQEDPGGLLPGSCKGGGDGWSGATVHKKTDIWYSFINYADFDKIDEYWDPEAMHSADELGDGPDEHGQQPEIANRPKWLVPMSLPVRVSDNNTVNTDNLKVQLDLVTGLPLPGYIPLEGALEDDYVATEHEGEGGCADSDGEDGETDHEGSNGSGGGWGMARYAYLMPSLGIVDTSLDSSAPVWDKSVGGDYRPASGNRWFRFVNKAGAEKTVAVTADGRPLDGDTGACRPALMVMPGGWSILGYEE